MLNKLLRSGEGKLLKRYEKEVAVINNLESEISKLTDLELQEETLKFRDQVAKGKTLEEIKHRAFAVVREASKRVLGQRHYDVQLMGGLALNDGNIAEMKTGEGKTLVSTLPAYLRALSGQAVHIVTANDYLAERDSQWMGLIFTFLGLTVSYNDPKLTLETKKIRYATDIIYGTNTEFGFDYLRDNMVKIPEDKVGRGYHFAIVDEVDSILIDEARTPLIISGQGSGDLSNYKIFAKAVNLLTRNKHYEVDEKKNTVTINHEGELIIEKYVKVDNLYSIQNSYLLPYMHAAIRAKELFHKDKDYIIVNREIMIVDEHTGRALEGRRYADGLHQAIEAKEGVNIQEENKTLATITLQNFFRLYETLSGMTGTAMTEEAEFNQIYDLGVVVIPTNREIKRIDNADLIYGDRKNKLQAIVKDVKERYAKGQPVLIGTTSVENSEILSKELRKHGIKHEVLNAKNHERESHIVARAGKKGSVTVATNMAGRGTDIILGGNPEILAMEELDKKKSKEKNEASFKELRETFTKASESEREEVLSLGGLYVLGTERHESRRIDNQLRGRSGRQGDPGETRFYLSLEDELMRRFGNPLLSNMLNKEGQEEIALESKMVSKAVKRAQTQVEAQNFEIRKDVLKYDDVINTERSIIYKRRDEILAGALSSNSIESFIGNYVTSSLDDIIGTPFSEDWDWSALTPFLESLGIEMVKEELVSNYNDRDALVELATESAKLNFQKKWSTLEEGLQKNILREIMLYSIDQEWQEHITEMEYLREGIGLRSNAQKDPLVEYKQEAVNSFTLMEQNVRNTIGRLLYILEVKVATSV